MLLVDTQNRTVSNITCVKPSNSLKYPQLGPATHPLRPAPGLDPLAGRLAASHPVPRAGHQLVVRPRMRTAPSIQDLRAYLVNCGV